MRILLLEDDLNRVDEFNKRIKELKDRNSYSIREFELIHFADAEPCINFLKEGNVVNIILLDHDLGGRVYVDINDKNTGSEVARWLNANYDFDIINTRVITHTLYEEGAENIKLLIPRTIYIPFLWQKNIFHSVIK